MHYAAGAPSRRAVLWVEVRERRRRGMRDRERHPGPGICLRREPHVGNDQCQGKANRAETLGDRTLPSEPHCVGKHRRENSIVASTPHGSQILQSGSSEWRSVMLQRINGRVEKFLATGARVILLAEPPSVHAVSGVDSSDLGAFLKTPAARDGGPPNANDEQYERMNRLLREVAARHPHQVAVIDLGARVCPSGPGCPYVVTAFDPTPATADQTLRTDGIHYLVSVSLWVAQWLVPRIAATAKGLL